MNEFDQLELSTETIRELSSDDLGRVAGGRPDTTLNTTICDTGTFLCPSGYTWTANCNPQTNTC